jgi:hypothetical protein
VSSLVPLVVARSVVPRGIHVSALGLYIVLFQMQCAQRIPRGILLLDSLAFGTGICIIWQVLGWCVGYWFFFWFY